MDIRSSVRDEVLTDFRQLGELIEKLQKNGRLSFAFQMRDSKGELQHFVLHGDLDNSKVIESDDDGPDQLLLMIGLTSAKPTTRDNVESI